MGPRLVRRAYRRGDRRLPRAARAHPALDSPYFHPRFAAAVHASGARRGHLPIVARVGDRLFPWERLHLPVNSATWLGQGLSLCFCAVARFGVHLRPDRHRRGQRAARPWRQASYAVAVAPVLVDESGLPRDAVGATSVGQRDALTRGCRHDLQPAACALVITASRSSASVLRRTVEPERRHGVELRCCRQTGARSCAIGGSGWSPRQAKAATVGFGDDGLSCALTRESAQGRHRQTDSRIRR